MKDANPLTDSDTIEDVAAFDLERRTGLRAHSLTFGKLVSRVMRRKRFWLLLALASCLMAIGYLRHMGHFTPESMQHFLQLHPVMAPGIFVCAYSILVVSLLPTLPLNLMAGVLWGTAIGSLLTVIGFSIGAICAFLIARHSNAGEFAHKYGGKGWRWLESISNEAGWKAIAFARINPAFPSGPVNYFFGLTRVSFPTYTLTTVLFISPPTILFSAIGDSIGSIMLGGDIKNILKIVAIGSLAFTLMLFARLYVKQNLQAHKK